MEAELGRGIVNDEGQQEISFSVDMRLEKSRRKGTCTGLEDF